MSKRIQPGKPEAPTTGDERVAEVLDAFRADFQRRHAAVHEETVTEKPERTERKRKESSVKPLRVGMVYAVAAGISGLVLTSQADTIRRLVAPPPDAAAVAARPVDLTAGSQERLLSSTTRPDPTQAEAGAYFIGEPIDFSALASRPPSGTVSIGALDPELVLFVVEPTPVIGVIPEAASGVMLLVGGWLAAFCRRR